MTVAQLIEHLRAFPPEAEAFYDADGVAREAARVEHRTRASVGLTTDPNRRIVYLS